MKSLIMLGTVLMLAFIVIKADAETNHAIDNQLNPLPSAALMFVLQGEGKITLNDKGQYALQVTKGDTKIAWYTKNPLKQAGYTSFENFLKLWEKQQPFFKQFNPKAVLVIGQHTPLVINLVKLRHEDKKLSFTISDADDAAGVLKPEAGHFFLIVDGVNP